MDTSDAWYPGSPCLSSVWGVPVPLLSDELLSSWLVRASLVQGCNPLDLTGVIWPDWRCWTVDIDRGVSTARLHHLSKLSGISVEAYINATLVNLSQTIQGKYSCTRAVSPWVLALGARNRRRHGGLQCCAACLDADKSPYYRLQWRLAWYTACSTHSCLLLDSCPDCTAPLEPHRLNVRHKSICVCATCGFDLRHSPLRPVKIAALSFQKAADAVILQFHGSFGKTRATPDEWFSMTRWIVSLVRMAAMHPHGNLASLIRSLCPDSKCLVLPATGLALELLPVEERSALLATVSQILISGLDTLLNNAGQTAVSARSLFRVPKAPVFWHEQIFKNLPETKRAANRKRLTSTGNKRSRKAVLREWNRLCRKSRGRLL